MNEEWFEKMANDIANVDVSTLESNGSHPLNQGKGTYKYTKKQDRGSEALPNNIEMIRQAIGMELQELLKRANITANSYYNIVNGTTVKPHSKVMSRLAEALGVYPPTDIYEYPTEEHRKIAREAYLRVYGPKKVDEGVKLGSDLSEPSVPKQTSKMVSFEKKLRVPAEFSEYNVQIFLRNLADFLWDRDKIIAIKIFEEYVTKWIELVNASEKEVEYLRSQIGEMFRKESKSNEAD